MVVRKKKHLNGVELNRNIFKR